MEFKEKIGISLSGGGVRAVIFHLGALKSLAERNLLENINFISTVSGGSLAVGLIYSKSGKTWPSSQNYIANLNSFKDLLTTSKIQSLFTMKSFLSLKVPFIGRARYLGDFLKSEWGITACLSEIPRDTPRWIINATCYETGKNWRFMAKRMGDYLAGYVLDPKIDLAYCLAASAAVPGMIGPLYLNAKNQSWVNYKSNQIDTYPISPLCSRYTIWDGGVYDNLGTESLFKNGKFRNEFSFLIVSDASAKYQVSSKFFQFKIPFYLPPFRLIDAATDQVRSLRLRTIAKHFKENPETGVILDIGNTTERIKKICHIPNNFEIPINSLTERDTKFAAEFETTLRAVTTDEYDLIFQHGYETAQATLLTYCPNKFSRV